MITFINFDIDFGESIDMMHKEVGLSSNEQVHMYS